MSVITRGLQLKTFEVDFGTVDQLRIDIAIVNALNILTFIYFRPICLYSFNQETKIIQIRNFTRIQKNTYNSIAMSFLNSAVLDLYPQLSAKVTTLLYNLYRLLIFLVPMFNKRQYKFFSSSPFLTPQRNFWNYYRHRRHSRSCPTFSRSRLDVWTGP